MLIVFVVLIGSSVQIGGGDDERRRVAAAPRPAAAMRHARGRSEDSAEDSGGGGASTAAPPEPSRKAATPGRGPGGAQAGLDHALGQAQRGRGRRRQGDRGSSTRSAATSRPPTSPAASNSASATLTLKIPSADLDKGLAQISKLAHVSSRSQQAQDVTDQRERLEALVRDARADREGLRVRLSKATTDKERARLRGLLDRASRRVTSRTRDLNQLGAEVSYATVELSIEGDRRSGAIADPDDRWTPGDALSDAGRVLEVVAGVALIVGAILLPIAVADRARDAGRPS